MQSKTCARTRGAVQWNTGRSSRSDGLQRAEGVPDAAETFVGATRSVGRQPMGLTRGGIGVFGRQVGADDIDAVERSLGGDAERVLGEAERIIGDADVEMLSHVAPPQHCANRLADRRGAAQWTARPLYAGRNAREVVLGGGQQLRAFAGPLFGEQRVLADHQAFARIVGAGDLGHVAVIKQRGLQRPARGGELLDRRGSQRGDPIQTGRAQRLLDPRAGQQSAVAHHHHALQVEALLQLVDLRRQRQRIGGIAFEHLDRYRAAVGRAHEADDNLRPVARVVAAVAMLRKFAAVSFEIGGGDIVEQQRAVLQVAAGQPGFDERLLAAQPVERAIDLLGGDLTEPQHLAQRMAGGSGIQHPHGRQLGRGLELWAGLMWINFNSDSPSLLDDLGDLPERTAPWKPEELVCVGRRSYPVKANWKLYLENFSDGYHVPFVHKTTLNRKYVSRRDFHDPAVNIGNYL